LSHAITGICQFRTPRRSPGDGLIQCLKSEASRVLRLRVGRDGVKGTKDHDQVFRAGPSRRRSAIILPGPLPPLPNLLPPFEPCLLCTSLRARQGHRDPGAPAPGQCPATLDHARRAVSTVGWAILAASADSSPGRVGTLSDYPRDFAAMAPRGGQAQVAAMAKSTRNRDVPTRALEHRRPVLSGRADNPAGKLFGRHQRDA
jgi:hypothetical protein